jgi:hypothetical protein
MSIILWSSHSEFASMSMSKKKEMEQMEIMQRKLLRKLQCLSNQVANTAVYVLIGAVPIYMMIERNMLSRPYRILGTAYTFQRLWDIRGEKPFLK